MNHSVLSPAHAGRVEAPCARRRAGVLLHISSLPGGRFDQSARAFLDFMVQAGLSVWQVLPLGPTHDDRSPYQCLSSHALNPDFLDESALEQSDWFRPGTAAEQARQGEGMTDAGRKALSRFECEQANWLDDYSLFRAIKDDQDGRPWYEWPDVLRDREAAALLEAGEALAPQIRACRVEQFLLFEQWGQLRRQANRQGILLFGDMPIFVAHDSADVWANREQFRLDGVGHPTVVAGVPPDYFSETGQRWGNPLFDWSRMEADGFRWWRDRFASHRKLFDWVRIDHFRGLEAYWEIPAECDTAIDGQWVEAPGEALLDTLRQDCGGTLPVIAEDLGIITEKVTALRKAFNLPGMVILQFAFDSDERNPYLPANHEPDSVVYTGTHDNDTSLSWFYQLDEPMRARVLEALNWPEAPMPWPLIHSALESVAGLAILPMQDLLSLGGEARMNTPGTTEGNWRWRMGAEAASDGLAASLREQIATSDRLP